MCLTLLVILIYYVTKTDETNSAELLPSNYGGQNVKQGEYTYVVALIEVFNDESNQKDAFGFCTGSMIRDQWVLTAAHCVHKRSLDELYVWYGYYSSSPFVTNTFTKVLKIIIHPIYQSRVFSLDYDIALLLVKSIALRTYASLSYVDYKTMKDFQVNAISGKRTNHHGDHTMRMLRFIGTITDCDTELTKTLQHSLCVMPRLIQNGVRICFGDSGGPVIFEGKIVGVCSFALVKNVTIGVFTPVSPFIHWITDVMKKKTYVPKKKKVSESTIVPVSARSILRILGFENKTTPIHKTARPPRFY
ncbi:trypsin-3-like [Spodoptera litura]|uniref:Trypsin-3-like n=1 Tax=Spodoptera litura TaxID=69820 RepID=A0A9J7ELV4_SPOLT|nr:trypsin-3-like [Spodoptera litura]